MKMNNIKKISVKIAILVVTSTLIVSGIVSFYFEARVISLLNKYSSLDFQRQAEVAAVESDLVFADALYRTKELRNIAESYFKVNEYVKDAENYFENEVRTFMNGLVCNLINNTDNIIAAYFTVHPDLAGFPLVSDIYFEETEDGVLPAEAQDYEDYMQVDAEDMVWFYGAYNSGKPYWTHIHEFEGTFMVSYVEPVIIDGIKVGVVGVDISIDRIVEVIKNTKVYDTGFALLADNHNKFLESNDFISRLNAQDREKLMNHARTNYSAVFETELAGVRHMATQTNLINDYEIYILVPKNEYNAEVTASIIRFIIIFPSVLLIVMIISNIIGKAFSRPLVALSKDMGDVADGKLTARMQTKSNDEIGQLNVSLLKVVSIVRELIDDINLMIGEREKGDTDYLIDAAKYNGDYRILAENILKLIKTSSDENLMLLDILNEFNNGNFHLEIPKQPGKKIVINQRVDQMKSNMQNLSSEIVQLTKQAIDGNLSARAVSSQFNGDWQNIINGLNELLGNFTEPVNEVNNVMAQVAVGNFDMKVQGNYKGDFLVIKNSINNTVTNIASYIDEIADILGAMAANDLDQEIIREYVGKFSYIKDALVNIITKLNHLISEIYSSAEQVAYGANQISDSSMTLAQGASEQAASIEELSAMIQNIAENTKYNANSAKEAKILSVNSKSNAAKGNNDMIQMLESMEGIRESSGKISSIIKIIEDIAFQTNLLALNAAVEAANAGVHGKGFSIVAEEVRNLAKKSQISVKDTTALIEESISRVNIGTKIAVETADTLKTIVKDVDDVANLINSISKVSDEQSFGIEQVLESVSQISTVVQTNTATSEESASASQELASQAELLKTLVSVFNIAHIKNTGTPFSRSCIF